MFVYLLTRGSAIPLYILEVLVRLTSEGDLNLSNPDPGGVTVLPRFPAVTEVGAEILEKVFTFSPGSCHEPGLKVDKGGPMVFDPLVPVHGMNRD